MTKLRKDGLNSFCKDADEETFKSRQKQDDGTKERWIK